MSTHTRYMAPFMDPLIAFAQPAMDLFTVASEASLIFVTPQVTAFFHQLSEDTGLDDQQIRYLTGLLLAYPLAVIHSNLPSPTAKHLWSGLWGVVLAQIVLGASWFHTFLSAAIAYVILLSGPSKHTPLLVFIFMLGHLACSHIYRIYVDWMGWRLDYTGPQMMFCIRFTCIAFNHYDGTVGKAAILKDIDRALLAGDKRKAAALKERLGRSCSTLPSPLVLFGYIFNYASYLAGPAFELSEYVNATNNLYGEGKTRPKGRYLAGFISFLKSAVCIGLWLGLSKTYDTGRLYHADILALPLFQYIVYGWIGLFLARMKYYFAWLIGEGACQWIGFGFNGYKDGKPQWDGVNNIDVLGVEFGMSVRDYSNKWNRNTQSWLQRYVYDRTGNSVTATYLVSAFWHGFYPGYYLFFLSAALGTSVQREFFRKLRPRAMRSPILKALYDFLGLVCTSLLCSYLAAAFTSLSLEYVNIVWGRVYYAGHVALVVSYFLMKLVPLPRKEKGETKEE